MKKKYFLPLSIFISLFNISSWALSCQMEYVDFYVAPTTNSIKFEIPFTNSGNRLASKYSLTGLNGIKGGVRAQVFIGPRWFLKGYADYGWIFGGNFSLNDTFHQYSGDTKGNLTDGSIGAGYNFYPTTCWQIAPTIGWSFEQIYIYTKNTKRDGLDRQNQRFKSILGGPYLGVETTYTFNQCWTLLAGYECHMAVSRIHVYDETVTTSAHLRNLIGNYAHLGVNYQISECWNAGIDLVGYIYNSNRTGTLTPEDIETTYVDRRIKNVQVKTGEIRLFMGYTF